MDFYAAKKEILNRFKKNILGKKPSPQGFKKGHDGGAGHWLEQQMKIPANNKTEPDLLGFELKTKGKQTATTFGDWSANWYVFKGKEAIITKDDFLTTFGKPNPERDDRYSWAGEACPKVAKYNSLGQKLVVDEMQGKIIAQYNYSKDTRKNKEYLIPENFQKNNVVLAYWSLETLREKITSKFNQQGWAMCFQNKQGEYYKIAFGHPIDFSRWVVGVKEGKIYFDSGMRQGNSRPYSVWRARQSYWESLIYETFPKQ